MKLFSSMIFLLVLPYLGLSQTIPVKDLQIVHIFPIGDAIDELGNAPGNASGMGIPYIPILGTGHPDGLIINDAVNSRLLILDHGFNVIKETSLEDFVILWPTVALDNSDVTVLESRSQGIIIYSNTKRALVSLSTFPEFRDYRSFAYYGDVLFVHDKDLKLWSIPEPGLDDAENRSKLLNQEQTIAYVQQRWGESGEVRVDSRGRLFIDGELVTRDFPTWVSYHHGITTDIRVMYIGTDRFGSTYWNQSSILSVYPSGANRPLNFHYDGAKVAGNPAIDYQTGDLYFLGQPVEGQIPLYRITRDW